MHVNIQKEREYLEKRKKGLELDKSHNGLLQEFTVIMEKLLSEKLDGRNRLVGSCEQVAPNSFDRSRYIEREEAYIDSELKSLRIAELEDQVKDLEARIEGFMTITQS